MCWLCWVYYLEISVLRYGSLVAPNSFCTLMMTRLDTQPGVLVQSMMVQMNEGASCTHLLDATADGIKTAICGQRNKASGLQKKWQKDGSASSLPSS